MLKRKLPEIMECEKPINAFNKVEKDIEFQYEEPCI
jgi:hypothetical protein